MPLYKIYQSAVLWGSWGHWATILAELG